MKTREDIYKFYHENSKNYESQLLHAPGRKYSDEVVRKNYTKTSLDISPVQQFTHKDMIVSSSRFFEGKAISKTQFFQIMHRNYFLTKHDSKYKSTTPSAGGLYPIEAYILILNVEDIPKGIYYYDKFSGSLIYLNELDLSFIPPVNLSIMDASFLVVFVSSMNDVINKYGSRGYRYVLIESGHIGQNFSLYCYKNNFKCCPVGGFYDTKLEEILNLGETEIPLYLYAIGV